MSDELREITLDERKARTIVIEQLADADPIELLQKWTKFLTEKERCNKAQDIADEFIKRWKEL